MMHLKGCVISITASFGVTMNEKIYSAVLANTAVAAAAAGASAETTDSFSLRCADSLTARTRLRVHSVINTGKDLSRGDIS